MRAAAPKLTRCPDSRAATAFAAADERRHGSCYGPVMWHWFSTLAFALPPDRQTGKVDVGANDIERFAVSTDGRWVGGRDKGTKALFVIDVEDWSVLSAAPCDVTGVAFGASGDDVDLWVGCEDGFLGLYTVDGGAIVAQTDEGGAAISIDVGLGEALQGVWLYEADGDTTLVMASWSGADTDPVGIHVLDPDDARDGGVAVKTGDTAAPKFREGVLTGNYIVIAHGGEDMSTVVLPGGSPLAFPITATQPVDIAPGSAGFAFGVDDTGVLGRYSAFDGTFPTLLTGLLEPQAIAANVSVDGTDDWIVVYGADVRIFTFTQGVLDAEPLYVFPIDDEDGSTVQDAVVSDGYVFGGGEGGKVKIASARPWVYPDRLFMAAVGDPGADAEFQTGDALTVTFEVDTDASCAAHLGGSRVGDGPILVDGLIAAPEVPIAVDLTVDETWDEGDNFVYIVCRDDVTGLTGHAAVVVDVDAPPQPPALNAGNLEFADGALVLRFDGIDDEDLDHYSVYVLDEAFAAADWPEGGPSYTEGDFSAPLTVTALPEEAVEVRIEPLTNFTEYWVAVRVTDTGGKEGPMSVVLSETPRPTYTAAELAGERGGTPWCGTAGASALGWPVIAALALLRRRRTVLVAALLPSVAAAGDWGDMDRRSHGNFEARYGFVYFADKANGDANPIEQVYADTPHDVLLLEAGPQFFHLIEVDFGTGFLQSLAHTIDDAGVSSSDRTMLTWWPLTAAGTLRLELIDEQWVVPFARGGFDYIIYSEKSDDGLGGKDRVQGAKIGNHYAFGANFLLDPVARVRASKLEAQTGINDSYLVVEWRRQAVDHRKFPWASPVKRGFDFSADQVTVGVKLDF